MVIQFVHCTMYNQTFVHCVQLNFCEEVQLYSVHTTQLDWKFSFSPWAELVSRRTQRRTVNPLPYSGVAGSLGTSEAPIHLRNILRLSQAW